MRLALLPALVLAFLTAAAHADTMTYIYKGQAFTQADAPFTTEEFVAGSFTTAQALAPDSTTYLSTALAYGFYFGPYTVSNPNSNFFGTFTTNALGDITAWSFDLYGSLNPMTPIEVQSRSSLASPDSFYDAVEVGTSGAGSKAPGSFTTSVAPLTPIPEPSTLLLLSSGLLGGYSLRRRKTAS